ncbi:MAG: extracellular solute-binding protein [Clostridia bacterium]
MKKLLGLVLALLVALLPVVGLAQGATLTMGSWRADDVDQMNNLLSIYKEKTGVDIQFQPINPPEYNATLRLQLDSGTGPDLMYSRSYATGLELFTAGYAGDCTEIPGVMDNFSELSRAPWATPEGKMFAVPFAAVSHGVYYNKDIFAANKIEIPTTFEELLAACETLKAAGITPFSNGVADQWDILECFFMGMLPNYIGGAEGRIKYENGEAKLNDENFVAAFADIAKLAPYFPEGYEAVTYNDSQILFATGKAAMFMDGSWTCGTYGDVGFEWSVFAMPAPAARKTAVCFHPDLAITYNATSKYPEECKAFLAWLASEEGVTAATANLPAGYFPLAKFPVTFTDAHINEILALNEGKETDARFVWPKLMNLYAPLNIAVIQTIKGEITAQQAGDNMVAEFDKLAK